jgi:hypothetical protein
VTFPRPGLAPFVFRSVFAHRFIFFLRIV